MPLEDSISLTSWPEEPSDGVSPKSFAMPWDRKNFQRIAQANVLLSGLVEGDSTDALGWSWEDHSPDGAARFNASVLITSDLDPEHQQAVFYRCLSMYLITRLNDDALKDACETLTEIYEWQKEPTKTVVSEPKVRSLGKVTPRKIARLPFSR